jgi:hypothetical protein
MTGDPTITHPDRDSERGAVNTRTLRSGIVFLLIPVLLLGGVAASAAPSAAPAAVSPPHIVQQATALTGHRYAREANRTVPYVAYSDGCNHDYGRPDQCIPLHSPPSFHGRKDKQFDCAYLTAEGWFTKPLLVRKDTLNVLPRHRAANKTIHSAAGWFLTGCVDG